jgi:tetratricopeptide (TPR) repeat protein
MNEEMEHQLPQRLVRETGVPLWPDGPSFFTLVERFVDAHVSALDLDSYLPLGGAHAQAVWSWYFQGATIRLAEVLLVHEKIAMMALGYASMELFPGKNPVDTVKLIFNLPKPALDGSNQNEVIHLLGVKAADEWLERGLETTPPTEYLRQFKELTDRNLTPEAANPGGSADLFHRLISSKPVNSSTEKPNQRPEEAGNANEIRWKALRDKSSKLFKESIACLEESTAIGKQALELAEQTFGPNHINYADSLATLGLLLHKGGQFAEAIPLYKRSLAITENILGPDNVELTHGLRGLGKAYMAQGEHAEAEQFIKRSLSILEPMLSEDAVGNDFWMIFIRRDRKLLAKIHQKLSHPNE